MQISANRARARHWCLSAFFIAAIGSTAAHGQTASALPEMVVTATRIPTPVDRIGNAITVITEAQIRERQTTSVADILRTVPGISVTRSGAGIGTLTQLRIRGAEANQTLVLIDGVEVNDPSGGSEFDFGNLLVSGIARIEILRGPQSALYGSDAVGGVINIMTKRGAGEPSGYASIEGGSFRTGRADAGVSGGSERVSYALYATGYRTDGISIASRKRGFNESDGYNQQLAGGRLALAPTENLQIDFVGRWSQAHAENDGFSQTTSPNIAIDSDDDTLFRQQSGRVQASLDSFGGAWQHILGASAVDVRRNFRTNDAETSLLKGRKRKLDYQTSLLYATNSLAPADHSTILGVEHEVEHVVNQNAFADLDRELTTDSIFAQQGITLWDSLTLTAAGRHDWNTLFEDDTTWRLSGAYMLRETGTKLKASYGTAVKAPTIFELFGFSSMFQGNPDLVPERSRGWDAGIEQSFLAGRAAVEAIYFDLRIDKLIAGFGNTARNLPGESHARGIELSGRYTPTDSLDLVASYTYTDTRDAEGNEFVRQPKHVASFTGTYRFLEDRASTTLGIDYNGDTRDLAFFPFPAPPQRVELPGYTLVRLTASYRPTDWLQIFGRIENALNTQYEETFSFATPGRAGYVGIKATF